MIQFRVWDTQEKVWATGFVLRQEPEEILLDEYCGKHLDASLLKYNGYGGGFMPEEYDTVERGRYIVCLGTGWKDKNDKKIYEGDILNDTGRYGSLGWYVRSILHFGAYIEGLEPVESEWWYENKRKELEVIGNRFENPELLKKAKK